MEATIEQHHREEEKKRTTCELYHQDERIGEKVFITQANLEAMIRLIETPVPAGELATKIYSKPIYILSDRDRLFLKQVNWVFQHPDHFIEWCYKKVEWQASNPNLVFKQRAPAYHATNTCHRMFSDYENLAVPAQIEIRGQEEVKCFKQWAQAHRTLFEENRNLFELKLCTQFDIDPKELQLVVYENSGYTTVGNENLDEMERLIDRLLREAGHFYYAAPKHTKILKQYQKYSGLGYSSKPLHSNHTGYPDEEVKSFLRGYRNRFQKPLKRLLISYLRVRFNSELHFSGHLLDQLGFKPCSTCHKHGRSQILIGRSDACFDSQW